MLSLSLLALLSLHAAPPAEALVSARDSLGDLNGLTVVVDVDDPGHVASLDRRALAAQIEAALRGADIHVIRYEGTHAANPAVTPGEEGQLKLELLVVQGTAGADPLAVVRYELGASQWARLEGDPRSVAFARTWGQGGVVAAPASQAPTLVRRALSEALEQFRREYAAARASWLARERVRAVEEPRPAR